MITINAGSDKFPVKTFKFSGGELQTSIDNLSKYPIHYGVVARLNSSDDIMELLLVDDILHRNKQHKSSLTIPYLPYGRQDRVMRYEEAFSLKIMAKLLGGLCFNEIITYDCHSSITNALVDNLTEFKQSEIIKTALNYFGENLDFREIIKNSMIIAPDAGASKKAYETAKNFNRPFAVAEKIRDISTGEIIHTKIDAEGYSALILDDICDGGRTFIELAKALREKGFEHVYLYVTHGIFSKGLDVFDGLIDHIFTTNTFREQEDHKLLTTFKVI